MKAIVLKEFRENIRLAALGLVIYTLILVVQCRSYLETPSMLWRPLLDGDLLWATAWFGGIFGAVLGWLQIHNERRPDLWAFLLHRPMTRTEIFLAKTLAGLGLYAVVVGVPLLGYIGWVTWPGHVATPIEPAMLKPVTAMFFTGILYYFAGVLACLRQARWYASRTLGVGVALIVSIIGPFFPAFWQAVLAILIGGMLLATAAWGAFQTHGYNRAQPACGKAALATATMLGSMVVAFIAAVMVINFLARPNRSPVWTQYQICEDGTVVKATRGLGESAEITDLEGKPVMDSQTGRKMELANLYQHRPQEFGIRISSAHPIDFGSWLSADQNLVVPRRATSNTLWYYWRRYDRLVGYDMATRRFIGSLGPQGFARDLVGSGDRFSPEQRLGESRTLRTASTVYEVDLDQRKVKPFFTTTSEDPIVAHSECLMNEVDWQYTAVATRQFIYLLTAAGQTVWKVPCEPKGEAYVYADIHCLKPAGQFLLWVAPYPGDHERDESKLPVYVSWIGRDQGVTRSMKLPPLPRYRPEPDLQEKAVSAVTPPAVMTAVILLEEHGWPLRIPGMVLPFSWASAVLVCLPIGWWLGRRYRFSLAAQLGWAVFHVLFGVPGLMAFLSVQEWPAREPCPNCKRLRLVDRLQCEHCGAAFPPPEKTGTEVFVPLGAKAEDPGRSLTSPGRRTFERFTRRGATPATPSLQTPTVSPSRSDGPTVAVGFSPR